MTAYTLTVRSLHDEEPLSVKRCLVNPTIIQEMGLCTGDVVGVTASGETSPVSLCVVWPSSKTSLSRISLSYNSARALNDQPPTKVQLWKIPRVHAIRRTNHVSIKPLSQHPPGLAQRADWLTLLARETLIDLKYVCRGQAFEVPFEGQPRVFQITEFDTDPDQKLAREMSALSIVEWDQVIQSAAEVDWDTQLSVVEEKARVESPYSTIGGLDKQIAAVRELIEIPLTNPGLFHQFGLKPPKGVLLYGPPGTGKTHLARAIASSTQASLLAISGAELASAFHGETEARLRAAFADARQRSPCIIVLDEVDALCPRREDGGGVEARVVATLLTEMDGMADQGSRIVVVATTNRPNAIDPALRRPGRFDREIEIGIPDAPARLQILHTLLSNTPHDLTPEQLASLAARTHGYVGADLSAVVRGGGMRAIQRTLAGVQSPVTAEDLAHALLTVRPSGLRALALETPETRWSDVGGQSEVQARLRESVEWPLLHPEAFKRLGVRPPAGVLLYGPPGCSKTLIARALATESGVNFLSVKGPELLNKYVGESERAVREIFTKARGAAPSIIFFDEIDALATARDDTGAHQGVLTSLLTEMDGIQQLQGVTVVAATNRPDVLDSALMRPGRLDKLLYVGPPDKPGRVEVLRIRTRGMSVDPALDLEVLAELTSGCSGAEITALCQDAALATMRRDVDAPYVRRSDFEDAARAVKRQITDEMVAGYARFAKA